MLSEARAREGTLTKNLEAEKQLRKNEALNFMDHVEGENRWLDRLTTVDNQAAAQLATMGMPDVQNAPEGIVSANCSLTLFLRGSSVPWSGFTPTGRPRWPTRPGGFARAP